MAVAACLAVAQERQLTRSARNHALDNNDNFSADDRFLCFDTRGSGQAIMRVDVKTGEEFTVFAAGPAVIAASYHPMRDEVVFIHGGEPYGKANRRGAVVGADGRLRFLDLRDVASAVTPPGAHRGGTHRHEYSPDGKRVGFTYDDQLLPEYGRTIGMLTPQQGRETYWFSLLVPVVPEAAAKPGDLVTAAFDSWVGPDMRAFIGRVKEEDGTFRSALFVVDIPRNVDATSGFAGDSKRFPSPPRGVRVRRLTASAVNGVVRGTRDGKRIAYLSKAEDGTNQVFAISSQGGEPRQVTRVGGGVLGGARWHPSGEYLAVPTKMGIAVVEWRTGNLAQLTAPGGDGLVWSNDGRTIAFNRKVGEYQQIFLAPFSAGVF